MEGDGIEDDGVRTLKGIWQRGKALWGQFADVDAGTHASSIAYFAFLSLVPLFALCISLVSWTGVGEQDAIAFFTSIAPDALNDLVSSLVGDAFSRSGLAFSVSTLTLLWSSSKGTRALRAGLNSAYGVEESRSAPVVVVISILAALVLGIMLAAMMYFIFSGGINRAIATIAPDLPLEGFSNVMSPVVAFAAGVLACCLCYAYLPDGKRRFISQLPGAVLASLACEALSFGFRVYVEQFSNFTVLYGSIATVALLLVWMYLISNILIAGGFLNRVLEEARRRKRGEENNSEGKQRTE